VKDATDSIEQVDSWWRKRPHANIGIATGGGVCVLDIDGPEGEESLRALEEECGPLPAGAVTRTGKGRHLWFAAQGEPVRNRVRLAPGIDVRGDGGYVVAPPSRHASGAPYRWDRAGQSPASAPEWLLARINRAGISCQPPTPVGAGAEPGASHTPRAETSAASARAALAAEVRAVREAVEGERNHTLNRAAFKLGQLVGVLDTEDVAQQLLDAALECGLGREEAEKTIRSGLSGGSATPRVSPKPAPRGKLMTISELLALPQQEWLVDGILHRGDYGVLFGEPGSGKTFVALDLALSVAWGS
jgi:hypothetical protein